MRTKTLYYPSPTRPELEVVVTSDGDIVSSFTLISYFDVWVDATEYLKNRPKRIEEIRRDSQCLDWSDDGDFKYECYKDFLLEIDKGDTA